MRKNGDFYTSGEFARKSHITKKTVRYYDEHNILKPSFVTEKGIRLYTDDDFARMQQVLSLKYLGFSLDEIREMTMRNLDQTFMSQSLHMQLELIEERLDQLMLMKETLERASASIDDGKEVDWMNMLDIVNTSDMDQKLKKQYRNSSNISARINLHNAYAKNKEGWFPWLFDVCHVKEEMKILELGCGDASLWTINRERIPEHIQINVTDISDGMVRDARKNIGKDDARFSFHVMDAGEILQESQSFDMVLANHVLFYCQNPEKVFQEVVRVLRPGGMFISSTYGKNHMKEISELVTEFDNRIVLSAEKLYEKFGKENGADMLKPYFKEVRWVEYEDELLVTKAEDLIEYVLSCHGNQNRLIVDRYKEFRNFVKSKTEEGFSITKEAGVFIARTEKQ